MAIGRSILQRSKEHFCHAASAWVLARSAMSLAWLDRP